MNANALTVDGKIKMLFCAVVTSSNHILLTTRENRLALPGGGLIYTRSVSNHDDVRRHIMEIISGWATVTLGRNEILIMSEYDYLWGPSKTPVNISIALLPNAVVSHIITPIIARLVSMQELQDADRSGLGVVYDNTVTTFIERLFGQSKQFPAETLMAS